MSAKTAPKGRDKRVADPVFAEDVGDFFKETASWETSAMQQAALAQKKAEKRERLAWCIAFLAVGAVIGLTPLHRVVTQTVYLDRLTGDAQVATVLDGTKTASIDEFVDKSWLARYVMAREGYYYPLIQRDFDMTMALSCDEIGTLYARQFEGRTSKEKRLVNTVYEKVEINSIRFSDTHQAVVNFEKATRRSDSGELMREPERFVATVGFEYKPGMLLKQKDRIENPLGFRVCAYRVDQEFLKPRAPTAAPTPPEASVPAPLPVAPSPMNEPRSGVVGVPVNESAFAASTEPRALNTTRTRRVEAIEGTLERGVNSSPRGRNVQ